MSGRGSFLQVHAFENGVFRDFSPIVVCDDLPLVVFSDFRIGKV